MPLDETNMELLQSLSGHRSDVTTCDFTPDYSLITGSSDKTVRIWDWRPGAGFLERPSSPLCAHKYQVTSVRVSPQGSLLATASVDGTAVLFNLHSLKKLHTMTQVNGDAIRVCRFSPDSSILVTGGDNGAICLWDLVHRAQIRTIFEHEGATQSLAFTPDSQYLVSACSLEVIKVWQVQDLIDTTTCEQSVVPVAMVENVHDMGVFCVDICRIIKQNEINPLTKMYTMASCGNSNEIKIWTIIAQSSPKHQVLKHHVTVTFYDSYDGHSSSVTCVRYDHTGDYLFSSSLDKTVKIWDQEGCCVATLQGHSRYVNCVAVSRDLLIAASGSNDKLILVWDLKGGLSNESQLVRAQRLSFNGGSVPEEQLLEADDDNDVVLLEKIDNIADGAINSVAIGQNGVLATGSGDKMVRLFRLLEPDEERILAELPFSPLQGHTYIVNYVDFGGAGDKLASCSLDGCTNIWSVENGVKLGSLPINGLAIKVCRFSDDGRFLITAGDDEIATIWDGSTFKPITALEGHLDTITSASFTPDAKLIATTSANADYRLWVMETRNCIYIREDAHEYGVQCCDFSHNLEPVPGHLLDDQSYLLATCGNDGLVKLWHIIVAKKSNLSLNFDRMEVRLWRSLQGHGGHAICVKFSPSVSDIVASTATDRQARIWSVYSAECLHVLDHDSIVTTCAFSHDCALIATGCVDKTLNLWKMPQQLVFRAMVAAKIRIKAKAVLDWSTSDVVKWMNDMELKDLVENATNSSLNGEKLMTLKIEEVCSGMDLDEEQCERFGKELKWLKQDEFQVMAPKTCEIPHDFLCPITHEIMREPVTCSDGFTYEKNAICEWFMAGKCTSPLTNEKLANTAYTYNFELRNAIRSFLETAEPN